MQKLSNDFYVRTDVVQIAKDLLGKIIVTKFDGLYTAGRIVETEAYAGIGKMYYWKYPLILWKKPKGIFMI